MPKMILGLHLNDWIVLSVYCGMLLLIGIWSSFKIRQASDFFTGGRRFGKSFITFFAFGAGTTGDQAETIVAGTWRTGLAGIWWQFLYLPLIPFYWLIAPILRRLRAITAADFVAARFSYGTSMLYVLYGVLISICFIAAALFSSAQMMNALTGRALDDLAAELQWQVPEVTVDRVIPHGVDRGRSDVRKVLKFVVRWRELRGHEYAILAMTAVFVIYSMAGGLVAAIVTDFIQGILTIVLSVLLLPFVFHQVGGFGALHDSAHLKPGMFEFVADIGAAEALNKEPITPVYLLTLSLTALVGMIAQPHIMAICGAGRSEFSSRFGFTMGSLLKRLCSIGWTVTGLACIVWYLGPASPLLESGDPDDAQLHAVLTERVSEDYETLPAAERDAAEQADLQFADQLFGRAAHEILPSIAPGLVGLLIASLLASLMSSCDAQMVVASGLVTETVYRRFVVPGRSERHYIWIGRLFGLFIVALALVLQTTFTGVIDAMKIVLQMPAAIGISMWFGIFWKRWNPLAVWVSTLAAAGTWFLLAFFPAAAWELCPKFAEEMFHRVNGDIVMWDSWQMLLHIAVGVVAGVVTSLMSQQQTDAQLDEFFNLLRAPVSEEEVDGAPCIIPYNQPVRERVIRLGNFQFVRPSMLGIGGFLVTWGLVFVIVYGTKWLSTML